MSIRPFAFVTVLAFGALLAFGQPAVRAQGPGGPPPPRGQWGGPGGPGGNPSRMLDRMSLALNLSPAQKAKMAPIFKAQGAKMRALRDDTKTPPPQKFGKMRAIMETSQAKINAILTPAQRTKFAAMRAQMRRRGPGGFGGPRPPGGPPPPGGPGMTQ